MSVTYRLWGYFRSSTSWRARIALHWKGLQFDYAPVHLVRDGGEQYEEPYQLLNPVGEVPCLEILDGGGARVAAIAQSVAILEYLEEVHPEPALLPRDPIARARVRQRVEVVNSSIHPLQNLKVLRRVETAFGVDRDRSTAWARHWISLGFEGLEGLLARSAGRFAVGDEVTLADVALVPQFANARRFGVDLAPYPLIGRVVAEAEALPAFRSAAPERQPDAE